MAPQLKTLARLDLSGQTVTEGLDFRGTHFTGAVTLRNAVFEGEVDFNGCEFDTRPDFSNAVFRERVWFPEAVFRQGCFFRGTVFEKFVDFNRSRADGDVDFTGATIRESLGTADCRFTGALILNRVTFEDTSLLGPLQVEDLEMRLAFFARRVRIEIAGRSVVCERASFRGGVQFLADSVDLWLTDTELGPASLITHWRFKDGVYSVRPPRVLTLSGTDMSNLTLGIVDLSVCKFTAAHNLDRLRIESDDAFGFTPRNFWISRRRITGDELRWRYAHGPEALRARWAPPADWPHRIAPATPSQVIKSYRALRNGREGSRDEPGAADFYYGEMEMRRVAKQMEARELWRERHLRAWSATFGEHALLWTYWLVSGYGLRAWRSLTALAVLVATVAAGLRLWGFPRGAHVTYFECVRFSVRESVSLLHGPDRPLSATGDTIDLVLRLLGPVLFGLAILALRGRVKR